MNELLRQPAILIFLLTLLGGTATWAVRQEIINNQQQHEIDTIQNSLKGRINPVELERRLGTLDGKVTILEGRMDALSARLNVIEGRK